MSNRQICVGQKLASAFDSLLLNITNRRHPYCLQKHVTEMGLTETGVLSENGVG